MKKELTEYQIAVRKLKRLLKSQKLTYREVAPGIGMSESGIKKVLGGRDGSFERLAEICRYAGATLSELLSEDRISDFSFTSRQEAALSEDPILFRLYWKLVYERVPVVELEKSWGLNSRQSFKLLRKLDSLALIQLLPSNRLRLPPIRGVNWVGGGPLVKKIYQQYAQAMMRKLARPDLPEEELFIIRFLKVSKKTYRDLLDAQRTLENEFVRRSVHEMRTQPAEELKLVRWITAMDNESFVD